MSLGSALRSAGLVAGIPLLVAVWAWTTLDAEPRWSAALAGRLDAVVRTTQSGDGETWLRVELAGRDAVALGEAPGAQAREQARAGLAAIPGLRRLADRVELVAARSPFVWSARLRAAERIDLQGYRPAELGRAALAARLAAALPGGVTLRDGARAARGAPAGFAEAAALAVSLLPHLAPGGVAGLSDATLSVRGEAPTAADYDAVLAALRAPPAAVQVGTVEVEPPLVDPYTWSLARSADGALALAGYVPSERARGAILIAVRAAAQGARVTDAMRPGRGLDRGIEPRALAETALALAGLLDEGRVSLSGTRLSVAGEALDAQAVGEVEAILSERRAPGIERGETRLAVHPPRPYRVAVRRAADAVLLTGHLPDAGARETVLAALRPLLFGERIVDRTRLAEGAPPGLAAALVAGVGQLALLSRGELALEDRALRVAGESLYPETAARTGAELARLVPAGWSARAEVRAAGAPDPPDAAACRERFTARVEGRPLRFAAGSADLAPDFYPVLDALAALARECRGARIEVAGHRDAPPPAGGPPANVPPTPTPPMLAPAGAPGKAAAASPPAAPDPGLPQRRALAVVDYLLKAGVPSGGIAAAPEPAGARGVVLGFRP